MVMNTPQAAPILTRHFSRRQIRQAFGFSDATLWRLRKRGEFPEPIRLSPGRVAWPEPVITAWAEARAKGVTPPRRGPEAA